MGLRVVASLKLLFIIGRKSNTYTLEESTLACPKLARIHN